MDSSLVAWPGVALLVIVTPGQATALTIRNTLLGGRERGLWTALGVVIGQAVWTIAASMRVAALLLASEPAFAAVRLAGAAYLIYLGLQALREARWPGETVDDGSNVDSNHHRITSLAALRQGIVSNLGNPKVAAFFTSLLPQFVTADQPTFATLALLGLTFCCLTLAWLTGYAWIVAKAGDVLRRPTIRRVIEGVMGVTLVALGLRLATEPR